MLLIGKGEAAHRHLMQQFEERRVEKEYLAVVHGVPALDQGVIDYDIRASRAGSIRLKMAVCAEGYAARDRESAVPTDLLALLTRRAREPR